MSVSPEGAINMARVVPGAISPRLEGPSVVAAISVGTEVEISERPYIIYVAEMPAITAIIAAIESIRMTRLRRTAEMRCCMSAIGRSVLTSVLCSNWRDT